MNQDFSEYFDESNEATMADAARRFESMIKKKKPLILVRRFSNRWWNTIFWQESWIWL
jgi:hypothetical protein